MILKIISVSCLHCACIIYSFIRCMISSSWTIGRFFEMSSNFSDRDKFCHGFHHWWRYVLYNYKVTYFYYLCTLCIRWEYIWRWTQLLGKTPKLYYWNATTFQSTMMSFMEIGKKVQWEIKLCQTPWKGPWQTDHFKCLKRLLFSERKLN